MFSISKIEKFRHIKSSIRKNPDLLLIGIDASKNSSTVCFYNVDKEILLKNYRVSHTHDGFHQFIEKIEYIRHNNKFCEVVVGVVVVGVRTILKMLSISLIYWHRAKYFFIGMNILLLPISETICDCVNS